MFPVVSILGVKIHAVTRAQTLAWLEAAVGAHTPCQVCTANPEFVMAAQRNPNFREILNAADLVLPDGVGLLWAARWQGQVLPERVAGSDLIYHIAERAGQHGWRLYFLGAAESVAEYAADRLQTLYPGWHLAGTWAGSPRPEDEELIVARIRQARPDVLLVAFGAPAQDMWIAHHKARLGVPVSMGVGGAFDFVAGTAKRAPAWVQRLGLEWAHRLVRQPWRWRRILTATIVFPLTVLTARRH
jgi:N-acetylglucosaminyldiphosphoundecaprenol N-acetyl-beta-D-mannosaminyltransferase